MPRETDEQDSTISVYFNYIMALVVTTAIFVVEYFTDKGWVDGVLIGVLISKVFDGVTKQNEYFFPTRRSAPPKPNGETDTDAEKRGNEQNGSN